MDQIILISWNVRGLNIRAQRDVVRVMVDDSRALIVCLKEMKLGVITRDVIDYITWISRCKSIG